MQREQIVFVGTSDLSGHFRGKSFPVADLPARLERGVGLASTNLFLSAFGPIQMTPFGTAWEQAGTARVRLIKALAAPRPTSRRSRLNSNSSATLSLNPPANLWWFWARERERCPLNWDDGSSLRSHRPMPRGHLASAIVA